jgi:hypothetical protein
MRMLISAVLLAGLADVSWLTVLHIVNALCTARRHRTRASRHFLVVYRAGFRAAHTSTDRAAGEASSPPVLPAIRHRIPSMVQRGTR